MLKEFIAQKEWICGVRPHLRIIRDMLVTARAACRAGTRSAISGYHIREAGRRRCKSWRSRWRTASATSSWGATPAWTSTCSRSGCSFFWDIHNDFFEEMAKLRAARRMWARIVRDPVRRKNPRAWMLRAHAQTAACRSWRSSR
jgi:methylmalonyl-CoA mutase N-terminal domain/subunit